MGRSCVSRFIEKIFGTSISLSDGQGSSIERQLLEQAARQGNNDDGQLGSNRELVDTKSAVAGIDATSEHGNKDIPGTVHARSHRQDSGDQHQQGLAGYNWTPGPRAARQQPYIMKEDELRIHFMTWIKFLRMTAGQLRREKASLVLPDNHVLPLGISNTSNHLVDLEGKIKRLLRMMNRHRNFGYQECKEVMTIAKDLTLHLGSEAQVSTDDFKKMTREKEPKMLQN